MYTLTLTERQMYEVYKSTELLMRLKLGQYQELVYCLCDINDVDKQWKVSQVDSMFKQTFELMNEDKKPSEYKDEEWKVLYDLFQVMRKAIHDAGDKTDKGELEVIQISKEQLPECKWDKR